jgi:hypothetical protein
MLTSLSLSQSCPAKHTQGGANLMPAPTQFFSALLGCMDVTLDDALLGAISMWQNASRCPQR